MRQIFLEHIHYRHQIVRLAWLDLLKQYRGSRLGWVWALVRPLFMLLVFWFVLRIGLRVDTAKGEPDFFPWLAVGMVSWFYMQSMLSKGTNSIKAYKHIVTKMKFPVSIIPTFVGLSNLIVHCALMGVLLLYLALFHAEYVSVHWVQLPLYMVAMYIFFVSWSLFASPLAAISKDFYQLVKSVTRVLFWLSGILWSVRTVGIEWLQTLMLFNPINFFAEGYRSSLLYGEWFWQNEQSLAIFAVIFVSMIVLALVTFSRTKKELADVL